MSLREYDVRYRRYYRIGDKIGIYPTPSSNEAIRLHYVKAPSALSSDSDTMAIPDDFKRAVAYGAALKAIKKFRAVEPEKYLLIEKVLKEDYDDEKWRAVSEGLRSGERFVRMEYKDF
jgi:hypothetical protein